MSKAASELVLNADGSIYHCNIKPEHLADTIITVGDPNRVEKVSRHFDTIEHITSKREIVTHTGMLNGKRLTVISTGMGTDNIDIVFSELDALANIDLETGEIKKDFRKLSFVRLGTSGALQEDIPVDSFVIGSHGLGLDGLLHYYVGSEAVMNKEIEDAFIKHVDWSPNKARPYLVGGSETLLNKLASEKTIQGITATACGFYGPQGRFLRLQPNPADINERLTSFNLNGLRISNFEMETSAIYGLAAMMGHEALSVNAIVANRILGEFSTDSYKTVDAMIEYSLERLTK
ncbi:nucleoside phosphorylase [Empedobacter stercoris]|uniref:nucleoside phosphorylase n=1 Tax=Empedobacter TaxID=59734 RepID=UPI0021B00A15|nr:MULTISPECIES: nucleoside phosphorylase [Empedobacter]MDM1521948.1 nucleoside phosphorylase [Empedobacter sp. 225-1]MDM1542217.1 nucleoside phosphorylase [Empedobacter sp. 189-2]UWX67425.1 nucleoside phosphorylase [Empedobacter stercoris]